VCGVQTGFYFSALSSSTPGWSQNGCLIDQFDSYDSKKDRQIIIIINLLLLLLFFDVIIIIIIISAVFNATYRVGNFLVCQCLEFHRCFVVVSWVTGGLSNVLKIYLVELGGSKHIWKSKVVKR